MAKTSATAVVKSAFQIGYVTLVAIIGTNKLAHYTIMPMA